MKLAEITCGMKVRVRFGSSVRPATVDAVRPDGRVHVRFSDVSEAEATSIPVDRRGNLFGATVRPNAVVR